MALAGGAHYMANPSITDRFNELTALAAVTSVIQLLGDLAKEPSTKRYNRTATQRRERWLQLASLAEQQAQRTAEPVKVRARVVKRASAPPNGVATPPAVAPIEAQA